ncbi:hypothetical protein [Rouxiella chamberiensis]|uniref:Uncharacterized protein n=1 Tax=Rouxiella chamberiensis TaxID=1513468 RepID=A0ABY7HUQ9_9GAMM|nr:hypothetical protein [Rouxiella chamberiensis]WAT03172.1 hypothetical protein O1V66_21030 [Rouxiella chamberiensis]
MKPVPFKATAGAIAMVLRRKSLREFPVFLDDIAGVVLTRKWWNLLYAYDQRADLLISSKLSWKNM